MPNVIISTSRPVDTSVSLEQATNDQQQSYILNNFSSKSLNVNSAKIDRRKKWAAGYCEICKRRYVNIRRHRIIHMEREKEYMCDFCGKGFLSKNGMEIHLKKHTVNQFYQCSECNKKYMTKSGLSGHMRFVHSASGGKLVCSVCGKAFSSKSSLRRHNFVHAGKRPYSCKLCGKSFTYSNVLKDHIRIHTNERPYKCKVCGKDFRQRTAAKSHERQIHEGKQHFRCVLCKYFASRIENMTNHMKRVHNSDPHPCTKCSKVYTSEELLQNHTLVHIAKRHQCQICLTRFETIKGLLRHLQRYENSRPFQCGHCGKLFHIRKKAQDHIKEHSLAITNKLPSAMQNSISAPQEVTRTLSTVQPLMRRSIQQSQSVKEGAQKFQDATILPQDYIDSNGAMGENSTFLMQDLSEGEHSFGTTSHSILESASILSPEFDKTGIVSFEPDTASSPSLNSLLPPIKIEVFTDVMDNSLKDSESESEEDKGVMVVSLQDDKIFKESSELSMILNSNDTQADIGECYTDTTNHNMTSVKERDADSAKILIPEFKAEVLPENNEGFGIDVTLENNCYSVSSNQDPPGVQHVQISVEGLNPQLGLDALNGGYILQSGDGDGVSYAVKEENGGLSLVVPTDAVSMKTNEGPEVREQLIQMDAVLDQVLDYALSGNAKIVNKRKGKLRPCDICGKEYVNLHQHRLMHDKTAEFHCKLCGEKFPNRPAMYYHMTKHPGSEIGFRCPHCSKEFRTKAVLGRHIMIHTNEKPHPCEICGKAFRSSSQLVVHTRTHTGEKPYACKHCDKKFGHSNALRDHERLHTGEKPYTCKVCGVGFAQRSSLRCHRFVHAPKNLVCEICGFTSSRKVGFENHMKTHKEREVFPCPLCPVKCISEPSLKAHIKRHTTRAHQCEACGRRFADKEKYEAHLEEYNGQPLVSCGECTKSFHTKAALVRHMITHTGREKKFTCAFCNYGFGSKVNLSKHLEKYASQKPFVCGHCGKKFHLQAYARSHVAMHAVDKNKDAEKKENS